MGNGSPRYSDCSIGLCNTTNRMELLYYQTWNINQRRYSELSIESTESTPLLLPLEKNSFGLAPLRHPMCTNATNASDTSGATNKPNQTLGPTAQGQVTAKRGKAWERKD